jgi:hypothetical protein
MVRTEPPHYTAYHFSPLCATSVRGTENLSREIKKMSEKYFVEILWMLAAVKTTTDCGSNSKLVEG